MLGFMHIIKADQQQQLIYSVDNVGHVSCSTSEALAFFGGHM
jgi:hypothetical protein